MSSWLRDLVISVAVSAFIIIFLYQPVRVEGTSMLPMLEDQDRLFVNKIAYRVGDIQRGDVVVFLYPHDHHKSYIKRVVALPGDDLKIEHGHVFVNGKELTEKYVPPRFEDSRSLPEVVIPEHEYFVMGDHRSMSADSRSLLGAPGGGMVPLERVIGRPVQIIWPLDRFAAVARPEPAATTTTTNGQ